MEGHVLYSVVTLLSLYLIELRTGECYNCTQEAMQASSQNGAMASYLIEDDYCFVDECTIRINDSNVLLNIINSTGDWITATNTTNLFMAPSHGTTKCVTASSDEQPPYSNVVLFVIQLAVFTATVIFVSSNLLLHLMIKELHTVPGALIASLCFFTGIVTIALIIQVSLRHQQNGMGCATALYVIVIFGFAYELTKFSALVHFTYLMYCSYKLLELEVSAKSLLQKYTAFVIGLTTFFSTLVITVDVIVTRAGFKTTGGSCDLFLGITDIKSISVVMFIAGLSILSGIDMVLVLIGLILYCLISKHCCTLPKSRDWRVSVALMSTIGYNVCISASLYIAQAPGDLNYVCTSCGTLIEQIVLMLVFLTSEKTLTYFRTCTMRIVLVSNSRVAHGESTISAQSPRPASLETPSESPIHSQVSLTDQQSESVFQR